MRDPATAETIRTFIAVSVPETVARVLVDVQDEIQSDARTGSIRWCKPGQFHVTLVFLGDVATSRMDELRSILDQACDGIPRFQLVLSILGCFPNERLPRVLWAGVSGDLGVLHRLQRRVADTTKEFRASGNETPFHPHITIGRIPARQRVTGKVGDALKKQRLPESSRWEVSEVELMSSALSSDGAKYERLAVCRLGKD
jgi:2'-5' RNA ligase